MRRLRDRLTLQRREASSGEYRDVETYVDFASRKCDIKPMRSGENYDGSGESIELIYEIRFRYEKGLFKESMRLIDPRVSPNRIFDDITLIDQNNMHTDMIIRCKERK